MQPDPKVSGQSGDSGELPTPSFSDQAPSSTSTDVDAIVSRLTPLLESLVDKRVQSTKDKRFLQLEKILGGRLDVLAELEGQGVTIPQEVRTRMEINDLRDQIAQPKPEQPAPARDDGSSTQRAAVAEAIAELAKNELDTNDPGFIELLRGKYANRESFDLAVQRHIVAKLKPAKPASPADVVQAAAAGGAAKTDLLVEFNNKAAKVRGNALIDLKMEYRKKGLDIN